MPYTCAVDPIVADAVSKAGGAARVARRMKISIAAVGQWHRVPRARVLVLSRMSGLEPYQLRPDLYDENNRPRRDR